MKNKKEMKKRGSKLMLIGILGIFLISLIYLVIADTTPSKEDLQNELTSLENNLTSSGYNWLVDYNITYPQVNVYRENSNDLLAQVLSITGNGFNKYQIFLTGLGDNESYETFDLRSVGNVDNLSRDILMKKLRIDELKQVIENGN